MQTIRTISLTSQSGTMLLDARTMAIRSLTDARTGQEFAVCDEAAPAFVLGYLDAACRYRNADSSGCGSVSVSAETDGGETRVTGVFAGVRGMDVVLTLRASARADCPHFDFTVELDNRDGSRVIDVQYPFVLCRFALGGVPGSETVALPHGYGTGRIIRDAGSAVFDGFGWNRKLSADAAKAWEFSADRNYCEHYPGMMYAQFLCYYNDRAGLLLSCDDTSANVKRFLPLDRGNGLRLGVSHVGDWPERGARSLGYRTRLRFFEGDWYAAADIYRAWFRQQRDWYAPIRLRKDVPQWLIDSPVYITIRPAGMLDAGPNDALPEFLPYEKCIPLLENIARAVNAPLAIVMMGWEKRGSWVYPDTFPPVGGEASMRNFIAMARARGWHVGTFGNGTHFVYENVWAHNDSGYELFDELGAAQYACREADGAIWDSRWGWRPCINLCISQRGTLELAREYMEHIADWGMESIQFLDQNNGAVSFPCFSPDHGHPPAPGKWMHEGMVNFMRMLRGVTRPGLEPIHSAESGLNEACLTLFHETELRIYPPEYNAGYIPLYQYLFHDCVILHAMMGFAPEPYYLALRSATAFVYGEIPGGVLRGDGQLLDVDTVNWAEWKTPVEDHDAALRMMRACNGMRRAMADYLVYGQMERPLASFACERHRWVDPRGGAQDLACVFHVVWAKLGGRETAVALTNWRDCPQTVTLTDGRLRGATLKLSVAAPEVGDGGPVIREGERVTVTLPAHCCAMLEFS